VLSKARQHPEYDPRSDRPSRTRIISESALDDRELAALEDKSTQEPFDL
jgi:hypothetical protein